MIDRDKVKLLLIDDHELTRSILRQIVHEAGYTQLREAADGETGLTLAKHFAPHLICLDNQMPGNSGLVVLGELKTALPSTKVVMITSSNDKGGMAISPDGRTLLYWDDTGGHIAIYSSSPNPADRVRPALIISGAGRESRVSFSPDGQWITYTSDESGRPEIYLAPYPVNRGPVRQQVSVGGGRESEWSADGRSIYYGLDNRIWRARVDPRTGDINKPELLARIPATLYWTLARDGRFLISRVAKGSERHSIKVILNWSRTLTDTTGH